MPTISRASIQNLKARVDIAEVVGTVVALKRAGSSFKGLSPFNAEKTPSFYVSPDKGLFKCFSSGKAGDVITFVMETERLGFTEAVEALAKRFNVPLEYEGGGPSREERSLRQELLELHDEAAQHFRDAFLASTEGGRFVREYWTHQRKFPLAVADDFKIGFAEPDGGRLLERLRKRGYSNDALAQCGLFYARGGGQLPPRFRGRLMIPIRDHQGRIVAFTARQLSVTPQDDPTREAKYVNSPETPIFVKGQILFNLDRARKPASDGQAFLMVEGQLDAIRCWTAGLATTIAPQGTSVTDTQLRLLHRYNPKLECLLDGDAAGQRAALRLLPMALAERMEVSVLPLTGKKDPDDLIREEGMGALEMLRGKTRSLVSFAFGALLPRGTESSPQEIADGLRGMFELLMATPSDAVRARLVDDLEKAVGRLDLGTDSMLMLQREFVRFRQTWKPRAQPTAAIAQGDEKSRIEAGALPRSTESEHTEKPKALESPALITVEHDLLLVLLLHEDLGRPLAAAVHHEWIDTATRAGRLLDQVLHAISHDAWPGTAHRDDFIEDAEDRNFLASLLFAPAEIDDPLKVANEGIRRMVRNFCAPRIRKIELEIAAKERNVDFDLLSARRSLTELRHLRTNPPPIHLPA